MADQNGESTYVIPSLAPSIGESIKYNRERADQNQYRQDQIRSQKAARKLTLINHVDSATDPAKYLIGEATIDQHTTEQFEAVKQDMFKYIKDNPDADPADIAYQVSKAVAPIATANAKQKAVSQEIDKNLALAKADLPILNDGKLREAARKNAFLKQLPNGQLTYKDSDEINSGTNYVSDVINNSPELVVDNEQPFVKHIQSLKTSKLAGKSGDSFGGVRTKSGYKADVSPFRDLDVAADGTVNGLKYKTENLNLPDGTQTQVVPKEQFDLAISDPNAKLAFYSLWNKNKAKYGAGGLSNDNPTSLAMQRKFMLDYLKQTNIDHSSYSEDDETFKNKQISDVEAGFGSNQQQWDHKEGVRQANRVANEATHSGHVDTRQDKSIQARKDLKLIPAAKAPKTNTHKKPNKYDI